MKVLLWVTLVAVWILWILGQLNVLPLDYAVYGELLVFCAASAGLLTARGMQPGLVPVFRLVGTGLILVVIGQAIWTIFFSEGDIGDAALLPNMPSYLAAVLFTLAAVRLYRSADDLFGMSRNWLIAAGVGAILIVLGLVLFGPKSQESLLLFTANTVASVLSAFTALLVMGVGFALLGGAWSRWISPLAIGFTFYLIGNVVAALTPEASVGDPADWFYVIAASCLVIMAANSYTQERALT